MEYGMFEEYWKDTEINGSLFPPQNKKVKKLQIFISQFFISRNFDIWQLWANHSIASQDYQIHDLILNAEFRNHLVNWAGKNKKKKEIVIISNNKYVNEYINENEKDNGPNQSIGHWDFSWLSQCSFKIPKKKTQLWNIMNSKWQEIQSESRNSKSKFWDVLRYYLKIARNKVRILR